MTGEFPCLRRSGKVYLVVSARYKENFGPSIILVSIASLKKVAVYVCDEVVIMTSLGVSN